MTTMASTTNDINKAIDLICQWLIGAIFIGFRFSSNFTLFFDRQSEASFVANSLPWQLELNLLEEWWIGDRQEWQEKVIHNGKGIEPDEPVKAFELTRLRWSGGAVVSDVLLDEKRLLILFQNGVTLQTELTGEDEYSFALTEYGVAEENSKWSVVCDSDGIYVRTP